MGDNVGYRRVGELEVDSRRRLSLGRLGRREDTRYIAEEGPNGEIRLIPARTVPAREAIVWENPEILAMLRQGMEEAALGKLEDRGSFAAFASETEPRTPSSRRSTRARGKTAAKRNKS
jgi:hypothetical protein